MKLLKGVSKEARRHLLAGETARVEFKERVNGLDADDLVAFANSPEGGVILIGVREMENAHGIQGGEITGHKVDDATRLQIMSKALSCNPPVKIIITVENLKVLPFIRIDIPSGEQKPYATSSGTYKIRENGRNAPIHPPQLLKIFMDREGDEFRRRFAQATAQIDERMNETLEGVSELESIISERIEKIGRDLGWADSKVDQTSNSIDTVEALVRYLIKDSSKQTVRLRAITRKIAADDPIKADAEKNLRKAILEQLKKEPEVIEKLKDGSAVISLKGEDAAEFNQTEAQKILSDVVKEFVTERSKKAREK